MISLDQ